jgi:pilus assembly protein CpaB
MRKNRPWFMLVLALVSGGLAAMLALRYIRQQATPLTSSRARHAKVVLATRALPVGSVVGDADVKVVEWPGEAVPVGYIGSASEAVGRGVITSVAENEPFLSTKLATKDGGGGLPIIIRDGMRAVSVKVDEVIGVAGFVLPGTRVDVLVTLAKDQEAQRPEPMTRTILQNVQALAAGHSVARDKDGKPQTVPVITLLVSPDEAELLALASKEGRIQLALRGLLDTTQVATAGAKANQLSRGLFAASAAPAVARAARPRVYVPQERTTVIVEGYKGGQRTLTTFEKP